MSSERTRFEFRMPDPGEGLTEAEIDTWHVEEGEAVDEGDLLCEVETDKALVEIPVPRTGRVVELRADPGDVVSVGEVIAVFETGDAPADAPERTSSSGEPPGRSDDGQTADAVEPSDAAGDVEPAVTRADTDGAAGASAADGPAEAADEERAFAAPSTRRYAREQGVDLADVEGSGPGGRVLREDVDAYAESGTSGEPSAVDTPADATATAIEEAEPDREAAGEVVRRPLRGLRKTVAENMVESKRTIPHVTSGFEADAGELVALKERLDEKLDAPVTYTTLVAKAVVPALREFPVMNASIDDETDEIVEKRYYNVGIATHTEAGLMVPVIEDVDEKSLAELGTELADLVERTREREVDASELRGGTFTITNTGSHSEHGTFGTPIIRHPEVAILGVGRISNEPVAVSDTEIEVRKRLPLTLSYDHRLVDGVTATAFAEYLIEAIEDPDVFLSRL